MVIEEHRQPGDAAADGNAGPAARRLPALQPEKGVRGWLLAVAGVIAASLIHHAMLLTPATHHLAERAPFSLMYPAVTFAALIGGTGPGLVATALATLIECLRTNPNAFPTLPAVSDLPRLGLFVGIDVMIVGVCSSVQRARRRIEGALTTSRRAERRISSILESITDAFYSVDTQWRYTYLNHQCEAYYGKPRSELLGRVIWDVFPQLLGTEVERVYRRAMAEQRTMHIEVLSPISKVWVEGHVYPSSEGLSIYFHNIEERRATQQALRQSEERYRLLVDTAQEGIWMTDGNAVTSYVNQAMAEMLGYPASEIVGRPMRDFMDPSCRQRIETLEVDRLSSVSARQDFRFKRKDGRVFDAHVSENPILGARHEYLGTLALVIDVTARRAAEAERAELLVREQRARADAEAANRRKDQFLAVLSHELRTPLTPVLARLMLLAREPSLSSPVKSGLDMIRRNVELEARLIDDLIDLTRLSRGQFKLQPTVLDDSIRAALSIYESDIERRKQTVTLDLRAENATVRADAVRLQQIFWNLIGNAVKYTPEGGHLTIRSHNVESRTGKLRVQVVDTGIGITPDVMPRIFSPFEQGETTLTRRYGGLGLGLNISRTLVQMHGGTLTAESAGEGAGSTFTVELPTIDASAAPDSAAATPAASPAPVTAAKRILLVDDNEDTLRVMSRLLKLNKHSVVTANSVAAALHEARQPFDLLLTDIGLPDGTGWDLFRQLREKRPNLRAIAISGFTMDEDVRKSLDAGFVEHLSKPISPDDLERAIAKAVGTEATTG